jgi:molybdopterin molybdotransferase
MLQPQEALGKVLDSVRTVKPEQVPLADACCLVPAQDVKATEAYPFFSNSSMDGYAVRRDDLESASPETPVTLPLAGEVRAAPGESLELPPGKTIRIMTGGVLPGGADAVVRREDVEEKPEEVVFYKLPAAGSYINRCGEEISAGMVLWPAGRQINPTVLGLLSTMGFDRVTVFPPPEISIITTGDELVAAGKPRAEGQIYDSISPILVSCLEHAGVSNSRVLMAGDDPEGLTRTIRARLEESDIVITVGGVSVGDYDLVMRSMEELGVERVFWKVMQKPGKPLFFGRRGKKLVFGLPGNPASALVCYLLYVLPAIRKMMGFEEAGPCWSKGRLAKSVSNNDSRTCFARGIFSRETDEGFRLETTVGQSSYMLSSFAAANALIELPPGPITLDAGQRVNFMQLPWV